MNFGLSLHSMVNLVQGLVAGLCRDGEVRLPEYGCGLYHVSAQAVYLGFDVSAG